MPCADGLVFTVFRYAHFEPFFLLSLLVRNCSFKSFLQELDFDGGKPIDNAFFMKNICGRAGCPEALGLLGCEKFAVIRDASSMRCLSDGRPTPCRRHNPDIFRELFPLKSSAEHDALADDKEVCSQNINDAYPSHAT